MLVKGATGVSNRRNGCVQIIHKLLWAMGYKSIEEEEHSTLLGELRCLLYEVYKQ